MKLHDLSIVILLIFFVASVVVVGVSYECLGQNDEVTKDIENVAEIDIEDIFLKEKEIEPLLTLQP